MRINALDGIRGIAVLLVIFFHAGITPFGWVGVQIFFVLSGYLITSILLATRHLPLTAYLARFYWRRSLRILPLYFAVLVVAATVFWLRGYPSSFSRDVPYLASFSTNLGRIGSPDIGPTFGHFWSLALEEQFYLVWPLAIYLLSRTGLKCLIVGLIVLAPISRLATYFYFNGDDPDLVGRAIYCLPFCQLDSFAFGAAIAAWSMSKLANATRWLLASLALLAALGAITILYMHFLGGGAFKATLGYQMYLMPLGGFVWAYSLINVTAMFGIVCALRRARILRFLEFPALMNIGIISYGMYILHVPVLAMLTSTGITSTFIYLCSTIFASFASYYWLEAWFLSLKDRIPRSTNSLKLSEEHRRG